MTTPSNQLDVEGIMINVHTLPLGNVDAPQSDNAFEQAMQLRSRALETYETKPNAALLMMTDAIELCPTSALILSSRAKMLYDIGELSAAVRDLNEAVTRSPTHAGSHRLLGKCHLHLCNFEESVQALQAAQRLDYQDDTAALLTEVQRKLKASQKEGAAARKRFEDEIENKKNEDEAKKEQQRRKESFMGRVNEEINRAQAQGREVPEQFQVFNKLDQEARNLSADTASRLLQNETVAGAFNDPEFSRKLDECAKDPMKAAQHMKDPAFMKAFQAIMGCMK